MSNRKLYDDLGVNPSADNAEIKKAYKKKAKKVHPDHSGSPEEFHKVNKAYLVLSDPERRSKYDATGDEGLDEANNEKAKIMMLIAGILEAVIAAIENQGKDPLKYDIISEMRFNLKNEIHKQEEEISRLKNIIKKTKRLLGKFKVKKGDNFIEQMLQSKINNIGLNIRTKETAMKPVKEAYDMLNDVTFMKDPDETLDVLRVMMGGV